MPYRSGLYSVVLKTQHGDIVKLFRAAREADHRVMHTADQFFGIGVRALIQTGIR